MLILETARMARILELVLNGRRRVDAVPDNLLLLDYLREVVGLTGTKTGCDGGECSAGSTKSSARSAAIAHPDSSWPRRVCCAAILVPARMTFAPPSAATSAAAPATSKSSRR